MKVELQGCNRSSRGCPDEVPCFGSDFAPTPAPLAIAPPTAAALNHAPPPATAAVIPGICVQQKSAIPDRANSSSSASTVAGKASGISGGYLLRLFETLPVEASAIIIKVQIRPLVYPGNGAGISRLQPQSIKRRPRPTHGAVIGHEGYTISEVERVHSLGVIHRFASRAATFSSGIPVQDPYPT